MRYAILSDVHGRSQKLQAVLADAQAQDVGRIVSLGDVGGDECLALLDRAGAAAVFGNYEVSGWPRLMPEHQSWVQSWPPLLAEDSFLAVHAVPWQPGNLRTVEDYGHWLRQTGRSWRTLFPYLDEEPDHLWRALAELEAAGKSILFHGHTHLQAIWQRGPDNRLQKVRTTSVDLKANHHYIVGVGSVGLPEDDCWAAYSLYDASLRRIELQCLDAHSARPLRG
jgi:hypothetical protein